MIQRGFFSPATYYKIISTSTPGGKSSRIRESFFSHGSSMRSKHSVVAVKHGRRIRHGSGGQSSGKSSTRQVQSSCYHSGECSASINQSIDQTEGSESFNQPINQSTYQSRDISSIPNQSINRLTTISESVFSLNCRVFRFWWFSEPFWVTRKVMEP